MLSTGLAEGNLHFGYVATRHLLIYRTTVECVSSLAVRGENCELPRMACVVVMNAAARRGTQTEREEESASKMQRVE